MSDFTKYKRSAVAELRPYVPGEDMAAINVSTEDAAAGSPKAGDMIARNPANNADQWLVAAAYFAANFEGASDGLVVSVRLGGFWADIPVSQMAMDKVLIDFNVTGDPRTTALKALSAAQIQIMLNHQDETKKVPDQLIRNARMRAASVAITQVELTQMPLVKAFFAKA